MPLLLGKQRKLSPSTSTNSHLSKLCFQGLLGKPTVDSTPELVEREYVAGHVLQEPKQSSQQLLMQMQSVVEHSTA